MPQYNIPRHGRAGKIILGVSSGEAIPALASIIFGFAFGRLVYGGLPATILIIMVGVGISRAYHQIKKNSTPGFFKSQLYRMGLYKYNDAFNKPNVIYIGKTIGTRNKRQKRR